uniref:Uncharacterized protein n=1 Tax=Asparagus officinalis TaxID=4686 RepID=Q2AAA7_ASPOF|nr:hypothetical protein 17.t00025 [Asparagus officinalis]
MTTNVASDSFIASTEIPTLASTMFVATLTTFIVAPVTIAGTTVFTSLEITATSGGQSEVVPSHVTPSSSFDLSKEFRVSMVWNNFLTILREFPIQVLDRGGNFAGIKAILEPLLHVSRT